MPQINVRTNPNDMEVVVDHIEGKQLRLLIEEGHALIDDEGLVRFFAVTYADGYIGEYKLLEYEESYLDESAIAYQITQFMAGFGIALAAGRLVKGGRTINTFARYSISQGFQGSVHGFVRQHYPKNTRKRLGYFNILNRKLIFTEPISIRWRTANG